MRGGALLAVSIAVLFLGGAFGGAAARSKPRAPVVAPVVRLVLGPADAPGLKAKRASAAPGAKAVAKALSPARLPKLRGKALASHFARRGAELWSLAYVQKSAAPAKTQLEALLRGVRRAGLPPKRAPVGQEGWAVTAKRGGSTVVLWRRRNAVGELLLTAKLEPKLLRTVATQYASVSDFHMQRLLSLNAWQRTLNRIRPNGKVPRKVALDLFALAYAPLPGTKRPPGPYGPPLDDGVIVNNALLRYWPTLTPAQQASTATALGVAGVRIGSKALRLPASAARRGTYGDPGFVEDNAIEKVAYGFESIYAEKLDRILQLRIVAGPTSTNSNLRAGTLPLDDAGDYTQDGPTVCRIELFPKGQAITNVRYRNFVLAHEVFHCFQIDLLGEAALRQKGAWLVEGSASWAAHSVNKIDWGFAPEASRLQTYLDTPDTPLFQRAYDAVGFFGHAAETTGDLWPRMKRVLNAPGDEFSVSEAGGLNSVFLDSWGSSTFNLSKIGGAWTFTDPLQPPPGVLPATTPITGDGAVYATPFTFARYDIDAFLAPEPLIHVQIQGYARLAILAGKTPFDTTDLKDAWFWAGEGKPKCPAGTEGTPPPATEIGSIAPLGLAAGRDPTLGFVTFVSLDAYCKKKQKPPKKPIGGPAGGPGGGGGGGGGSSNGDPHLITFDALFYDFQGAGEYTLARSRSGAFEVQAREEPYPGIRDLAVNSAIAMRVARSRIVVYKGFPQLVVRVNGRGFIPAKKSRTLPGGGRIRLVSGQVEVVWPDGTLARLWPVGSWGVAILIKPTRALRGKLEGLLGNFDGNQNDDFVTRAGRRLDSKTVWRSYRLLYRVFGDSWRITQRRSLFDYSRGQSTRTFTSRSYPSRILFARNLPPSARQAAERFCRTLHIKNPEVFQACLLDVGGTGDGSFATAAAQLERTAGGFPVPKRVTKPKRKTKPGSAKGAKRWARASSGTAGALSVAVVGGKVVVAYRSGQGSAEAATFTPSTTRDVAAPRRNPITSGWGSIGDPVLLPHAGGGLQALLNGIHGGNDDPLNGVSFAVRNANGSFGPPTPATASTFAEFVAGDAVLGPDGAPLWVSIRGGTLWVWRGATLAVGADLSSLAGGPAGNASVGRDRRGRYWLAWDTVFASDAKRNGLYLQQFDPKTLQPIGSAQQVPNSAAIGYAGRLALACWTACRLIYQSPVKRGLEVVSWGPGERKATIVAPAKTGHSVGQVAAAYTSAGRLWVAWWDNGGNAGFGYRAALGDARGARSKALSVGKPAGNTGAPVTAVTVGGNLVLVAAGKGSAAYVNVLAPAR